MIGGCHCGDVSVALPARPDYINLCDCSLCAKSGGAWGYFTADQVRIEGATRAYRRADRDTAAVEMHFCDTCGTTTHWVLTEHAEGDRVGVNMRIFAPSEVSGIEARTLDGRNWSGDGEADHRRAIGILGQDVFL